MGQTSLMADLLARGAIRVCLFLHCDANIVLGMPELAWPMCVGL